MLGVSVPPDTSTTMESIFLSYALMAGTLCTSASCAFWIYRFEGRPIERLMIHHPWWAPAASIIGSFVFGWALLPYAMVMFVSFLRQSPECQAALRG